MDEQSKKKGIRWGRFLLWIAVTAVTVAAVWFLLQLVPKEDENVDILLDAPVEIETEPVTEPDSETPAENIVPPPNIDVQPLSINDYSRPGEKVDSIDYIVIHYLGNPKTTAQENHDYFESLKDLQNTSMSANFVVGIEGEIIECVPPGEIAYASNSMNHLSISIENCHLDDSGRFTQETYNSCVHLTAYLAAKYDIDREHIIRHYDVTGKECPLYYVEHEDKWEEFRDDVMTYIEECKAAAGLG